MFGIPEFKIYDGEKEAKLKRPYWRLLRVKRVSFPHSPQAL